ncbi:MAG: type I methionyl aminopeptidase [Acidimicrobiia bacterium]|nr:type I methionyl aminopeptidase [Acidimicrobiia bacterium]MBJ7513521.1 type I methionyl aminopeptidase [Acidimicrobiia bacterium]
MVLKSNDPCWCGSGEKYKRCHKPIEKHLSPGFISPMRSVPPLIPRPPYAETGNPPPIREGAIKSLDVIERMRGACSIAAEILREAGALVAPGITTDEIDIAVHEATISRNAYPSPLNYRGFPKSVCTSVNEVICHGIPDDRALENGDILNIDVTAYIDGVHGDTNATFLVGDVDAGSRRLVEVTRECLELAIDAVIPGRPLSDIGRAIEGHATENRFSVIRTFVGHGIGEQFHGEPSVLHYYEPRLVMPLEPGMVFTIEPMIAIGDHREKIWSDGWTAVTQDGLRTAQFEHTILVTESGSEVLTR